MITYVLYCYTKNKNPRDPEIKFFEIIETFSADHPTPFVQNKLVHKAIDNGFFVQKVRAVRGEAAS